MTVTESGTGGAVDLKTVRLRAESPGVVENVSLGRAVAVAALAPIAERLADERERQERKAERERQLEEALAAAPPLDKPAPPDASASFWRTQEFRELLLGLVVIGIPAFFVLTAVFALLFSFVVGLTTGVWILGAICSLAILQRMYGIQKMLEEFRRGRELAKNRDNYATAVKAFDDREAERAAIRATLDRGVQ